FRRSEIHIVSSYRVGLHLTLQALELDDGDEVLLTPITIADSINAITIAGLRPIFLEMDKDSHCLSLEDLKNKTTSKTRVLIITFLSGIIPNLDDIYSFTKEHGI